MQTSDWTHQTSVLYLQKMIKRKALGQTWWQETYSRGWRHDAHVHWYHRGHCKTLANMCKSIF